MLTSVTDYLLVTPTGAPADTDTATPAGSAGPVALASRLTLEVPDDTLGPRLVNACRLKGENWKAPDPYGPSQAFVLSVDPAVAVARQRLYAWDTDDILLSALALSRLVRPHATACDYAVRRLVHDDGSEQLIPHDAEDARVAFRLDDGSREWLDAGEADQLRALLAAWAPDHLPRRVRLAWWQCESMVRERYLEDTLLLIVSGLEALLKIGRHRVTAQFVQRAAALAAQFSIPLTESQADAAYDDRSGISHGNPTDLSQPVARTEFVQRTDLLQQTLRATVRKAIEDPAYRALFASDGMIQGHLPVAPR